MKKNIIIIGMILSNIYLLISIKKNFENREKVIETITKQMNKIEKLEKNMFIKLKTEGYKLNDDLVFIDFKNNHYSPKKISEKSNKFLFFSKESCHDCINTEIKNIKKIDSSLRKELSIIVDYNSLRELFVFSESLSLRSIKFYLLKDSNNSFLLKKYKRPIYFDLDSTLRFKNVFVPSVENQKLTNLYLLHPNKKD